MVRGNILDKMVGKDAQIHLSRDPSEDFEKPWKRSGSGRRTGMVWMDKSVYVGMQKMKSDHWTV